MNAWQALQQVEYLLRLATWEDAATLVFSRESVVVSSAMPEHVLAELTLPLAMISLGSGIADPQHHEDPTLREEEVRVTIGVINENDQLGRGVYLGARGDGANDSRGRGLLEIAEILENTLDLGTGDRGFRCLLAGTSAAEPARHPTSGLMLMRTYTFRAKLGRARAYPAPTSLVGTGGAGQVALSWRLPPARFDTRRVQCVRKAGSSAPSSPTDGTVLTLGGTPDGAGVTSKTNTGLAAGTYTFGLFAAYDETGSGTDERWSPVASVTATVT